MNGINFLLADTNTLIQLLDGHPQVVQLLDNSLLGISFITEIELQCKSGLSIADQKLIHDLLQDCLIFDPDPDIKRLTVEMRQNYRLKLPDAFVAATALSRGLPLVTADVVFGRIDSLSIIAFIP
ncbi:MAG: type II toxin-antitoxin system VapC family toxin [Cytophagaceae bacterium]|nr:type II toxin-antitoxin system VapC family toxin [Cytophagaceae bacterium]